MRLISLLAFVAVIGGVAVRAQAPDGPTIPNLPDVNPQLLRLVVDDQWDRGNDMFSGRQLKPPASLDLEAIGKRDAERRSAVRSLIKADGLRSGREYQFAAILFQHSDDPNDVQYAHLLAVTAVMKGYSPAKYLAAASFDRVQWNLNRPQVFGTQFRQDEQTKTWTMEPYDRDAVPDALRAAWCVVGQSEQAEVLKKFQAGAGAPSTSIADCK